MALGRNHKPRKPRKIRELLFPREISKIVEIAFGTDLLSAGFRFQRPGAWGIPARDVTRIQLRFSRQVDWDRYRVCLPYSLYPSHIWQVAITQSITQAASTMADISHSNYTSRTPVYFLGIGGPNFIENQDHPAFAKLAAVGQEVTTQVKPKAIVIFSAHWQGGPNKIKINVAEKTDIMYDYKGFPPHFY